MFQQFSEGDTDLPLTNTYVTYGIPIFRIGQPSLERKWVVGEKSVELFLLPATFQTKCKYICIRIDQN